MTAVVRTRTIDQYRQSCLDICAEKLAGLTDPAAAAKAEGRINAYPGLENLQPPRGVVTLDPEALTEADRKAATDCLLSGRFFAEHAAAGEATRLKMGTKYLINPCQRLTAAECAAKLSDEEGREVTEAEVLKMSNGARPEHLLDLSLGQRHMLQMTFDLAKLAGEHGQDSKAVIDRQWTLVILNQASAEDILADFRASAYFGFNPDQVLFMVQESFEGINAENGRWFFDPALPKRLHNHGQMAMQKTAENQLFSLAPDGVRRYITPEQATEIMDRMDDKLSYNIEDLAYLTGALDLDALALALKLGREGYNMVMEIVGNNPVKPQKGGMAAWDPALGRNVMIESFQLLDLPNEKIVYLNRNFNHYPNPRAAFEALAKGLPMPITVKGKGEEAGVYFQPIQGDLNFLLKTAFVQRKVLPAISGWKSAATTPLALAAMAAQDNQDGFKDFAADTLKRSL